MIKYVFCIWMFLGFKHNMCLRGGMFSLFDFCFFCWMRLYRGKFFHCKGRQQFWERKAKSRRSHRKIRKVESWKVKRLHCQFRKVKKSKSGTVSFSISKSWKVNSFILISKKRKVKKLKNATVSFSFSKSWKVKRFHF